MTDRPMLVIGTTMGREHAALAWQLIPINSIPTTNAFFFMAAS
jgi:hypothetical protein